MRYETRKEEFSFSTQRHLSFSAHMHDQIELVLVQHGKARVWVDAKEYSIADGDAFIVFPNQVHEYFDIELGEHLLMIFSAAQIPALTTVLEGHLPESPVVPLGEDAPLLAALATRAAETYRANNLPHKTAVVGGYMTALVGEICRRLTFGVAEAVPSGNAKKVINYCRKHYREDISLEILERELYINRYYISHMFADYLHVGFNEYINSLRVFEACRRLRHDTASITEIAQQVGFGSPRTFNRAFRKKMGMSPSEYRADT